MLNPKSAPEEIEIKPGFKQPLYGKQSMEENNEKDENIQKLHSKYLSFTNENNAGLALNSSGSQEAPEPSSQGKQKLSKKFSDADIFYRSPKSTQVPQFTSYLHHHESGNLLKRQSSEKLNYHGISSVAKSNLSTFCIYK